MHVYHFMSLCVDIDGWMERMVLALVCARTNGIEIYLQVYALVSARVLICLIDWLKIAL